MKSLKSLMKSLLNSVAIVACVAAVLLAAVGAAGSSTTPRVVNTTGWSRTCYFPGGEITTNCGADDGADFGATAVYNRSRLTLGWDYLEINGIPGHATGFVEGYVTAQTMYDANGNMDIFSSLGPKAGEWIHNQWYWMAAQAKKKAPFSTYWHTVQTIQSQVAGLRDGFNFAVSKGLVKGYNRTTNGGNVTLLDMFSLNLGPEIGDIFTAVMLSSGELNAKKTPLLKESHRGAHCSGLVKVTHDDLFVSHDTWGGFSMMAWRMYKVYRNSGSEFPKFTQVSFSGYPGAVSSVDDWYQVKTPKTSAGQEGFNYYAVQETSNSVLNISLYSAVVPQTVAEFIRVMTANYLVTSGEQWTENFARHNSGTYNNQWMVVDFNKYSPGSSIVEGTLWIAEQIPGYVARLDVSDVLRKQGYWASYNIPYDEYIYNTSGYPAKLKESGSFWSYSKYARPEIFKRNNTDVHDITTMMRLMRYNNYKHDDLSLITNCTGATGNVCTPDHSSMLAVASRGDLMPKYQNKTEKVAHFGIHYDQALGGCFGAIDTKIASFNNRYTGTSWVINGPTNDQQPTFTWSGAAATGNCPPASPGFIETFDFDWISFYTTPFSTSD